MIDFKTLGKAPLQPSNITPTMPSGGMTPPDMIQTGDGESQADPSLQGPPGIDQMPSSAGLPGDGSGMATEEQMNELRDLLAAIEQKQRENESEKIAGKNVADSASKDLLSAVFQLLQEAGVDLTDQNSINEFLAEMEKTSPDLYQMFVEVLDSIMDPEAPKPEGEALDLSQVPSEDKDLPATPSAITPPTQTPPTM